MRLWISSTDSNLRKNNAIILNCYTMQISTVKKNFKRKPKTIAQYANLWKMEKKNWQNTHRTKNRTNNYAKTMTIVLSFIMRLLVLLYYSLFFFKHIRVLAIKFKLRLYKIHYGRCNGVYASNLRKRFTGLASSLLISLYDCLKCC